MTVTAAQTTYFISLAATQFNLFTRLMVFMDAVHVFQDALYNSTLLPQHALHPRTITYIPRVNKFKHSHLFRVKMNVVKSDNYLPATKSGLNNAAN
jgi:hypothetical protein